MSSIKKVIDWDAVEREYRAGQLSLREIGRLHDVSDTAIRKRAKVEAWLRDLGTRVSSEISARLVHAPLTKRKHEREVIDDAAARGVDVVLQHRATLARLHDIMHSLFNRLERHINGETGMLAKGETSGALLETLSRTLVRVIDKERQAFNLDIKEGTGSQATIQFLDYRATRDGES